MAGGITFLPNDRYLLENEKFRLYYTAEGEEAHNFIVVVEDNFSNSYELEFDFNNRNVKDDGLSLLSPSATSNPSHDDACIHDYPLFASGGLFRIRTEQTHEGTDRQAAIYRLPPLRELCAVPNTLRVALGETSPVCGIWA